MKKIIATVLVVTGVLTFSGSLKAQDKSESTKMEKEKSEKPEWKEMEAFHDVMAKTFHPSEEGNLEPVKKMSGLLVTRSEEWMKSTPPTEYATASIKQKIEGLYKETTALDLLVKNKANDESITKELSKLHDQFHTIIGECRKGEHEGHGPHDGHGHK